MTWTNIPYNIHRYYIGAYKYNDKRLSVVKFLKIQSKSTTYFKLTVAWRMSILCSNVYGGKYEIIYK